jgi:hypothetical protein
MKGVLTFDGFINYRFRTNFRQPDKIAASQKSLTVAPVTVRSLCDVSTMSPSGPGNRDDVKIRASIFQFHKLWRRSY